MITLMCVAFYWKEVTILHHDNFLHLTYLWGQQLGHKKLAEGELDVEDCKMTRIKACKSHCKLEKTQCGKHLF